MKIISSVFLLLALAAGPAAAQETDAAEAAKQPTLFAEASGAFGMQLGEQSYLPTADGQYMHPMTSGYAVGATAGWQFMPDLALAGTWEYASANSRNGEVTNALDDVEGTITYHTVALGARWTRPMGPGRLYGELGAGVIMPFETRVHYDYAAAMGGLPTPILGTGDKIDEYNLGVGAYGQLGYQLDLTKDVYVSAAMRLKSFQSNNDGRQTRFENFVPNMSQPQAMNATIEYDSDAIAGTATPTTYSVQDLRAYLAVGFRL